MKSQTGYPYPMETSSNNPSQKLIWISLVVNLLICIIILPLILQPGSTFNIRQLLETLFWQGMGLIAWPITLVMALISPLFSGSLPRLGDIFSLILYPLIEISLILIIAGKKYKWILLLVSHILILMSFIMAWTAILGGYNFMVG